VGKPYKMEKGLHLEKGARSKTGGWGTDPWGGERVRGKVVYFLVQSSQGSTKCSARTRRGRLPAGERQVFTGGGLFDLPSYVKG